jgi:hypothetical protein
MIRFIRRLFCKHWDVYLGKPPDTGFCYWKVKCIKCEREKEVWLGKPIKKIKKPFEYAK